MFQHEIMEHYYSHTRFNKAFEQDLKYTTNTNKMQRRCRFLTFAVWGCNPTKLHARVEDLH
jgi:hypothetical protein